MTKEAEMKIVIIGYKTIRCVFLFIFVNMFWKSHWVDHHEGNPINARDANDAIHNVLLVVNNKQI